MDISYHIVLPCNRKHDTAPVMKLENFTTSLPEEFELQDEWEVALTEITYPKIWVTLPQNQKIDILKFNKYNYNLIRFINYPEWFIEKGEYTIEQLIEKCNMVFATFYDKNDNEEKFIRNHNDKKVTMEPILEMDPNDKEKLKLKLGCLDNEERFFIRFGEILGNILGFGHYETTHQAHTTFKEYKYLFDQNPDHKLEKWKESVLFQKAPKKFDINRNLNYMHITCDLVKDSYFGDIRTDLLRTIYIENGSNYGDQITEVFENPYYYPINKNNFDKINIKIYQNLPHKNEGELMPFSFGTIHLNLHLKKCNKFITTPLEPLPENPPQKPQEPDIEREEPDNPSRNKVINEDSQHPFANWS